MYNNTGSLMTFDSDKTSEFKFSPINIVNNNDHFDIDPTGKFSKIALIQIYEADLTNQWKFFLENVGRIKNKKSCKTKFRSHKKNKIIGFKYKNFLTFRLNLIKKPRPPSEKTHHIVVVIVISR